jgi:hypothetical protein
MPTLPLSSWFSVPLWLSKFAQIPLRACPADCIEHRLDFGIGHEQIPAQLRAIVLDHNHKGNIAIKWRLKNKANFIVLCSASRLGRGYLKKQSQFAGDRKWRIFSDNNGLWEFQVDRANEKTKPIKANFKIIQMPRLVWFYCCRLTYTWCLI